MPSLSEIGGPDELRFRYSRRKIFLVEGPGDRNAFETLLGPGYEADIEFQIARTAGGEGGCTSVRNRVREMRPANDRVFGLLDGEVAASIEATEHLLDCTETLFEVAGHKGLVFLGVHELENIYLTNADVAEVVSKHCSVAKLHLNPSAAVAKTIETLISRFVRASIYKYTSAHFHSRGQMRSILNTKIFGHGSSAAVRTQVVAAVTSGGGTTWPVFVSELLKVGKTARAAMRRSSADRKRWLLRIADGKELLARVRLLHGPVGEQVEGALLREVCRSDYPDRFREALFRIADVRPSTFAA